MNTGTEIRYSFSELMHAWQQTIAFYSDDYIIPNFTDAEGDTFTITATFDPTTPMPIAFTHNGSNAEFRIGTPFNNDAANLITYTVTLQVQD